MVFLHIFDIQILEYNRTVLVHHPAGSLMSKIEPSVSDPFMDVRDDLPSLLPFRGALLCFREFSLCLRKGFLVGTEESGVLDLLPV
jgi:hypothetical protein